MMHCEPFGKKHGADLFKSLSTQRTSCGDWHSSDAIPRIVLRLALVTMMIAIQPRLTDYS